MIRRVEWLVIGLILGIYLVIAGLYATRTPDWQAPDEPAHYNYVRQIAEDGRLPVLEMGDWQQSYQNELVASGFDPALMDRVETIEYEDHQPPLYYLLQAPIYALTDGDLTAMRLLSVLLGAGFILTTWGTLSKVLPGWPTLALAGAAFVAFLPQHLAVLGSVSNDSLAELVVGLTLLAVVVYLENGRRPVVLGVLAGIAMLTKTTIYFLGGIVVLAILLRWWREKWSWRQGAIHLAAILIPVLIIGGLWWVRNLDVYGGTDFTALTRHDEVTVGQPRTGDYIDTMYGGSTRVYLENYVKTTFRSFWGQFGWMAVPYPSRVYTIFLALTLIVLVGAGLFFWSHARQIKWDTLIILAAVLAAVFGAYILYNFEFVQFQGRYLYYALVPFAFLVAVGLGGWTTLLDDRFSWVPVVVMFGLALFAFYALDTYIVPNLS